MAIPPRPLPDAVPPEYPDAALNAGIEGPVSYRAMVGADGTVKSVEILKVPATGYGFEDAVRRAVIDWTFAPATSAGKPVDGKYAGVAQFSPSLSGEFVFPVTSDVAWEAVQRLTRELAASLWRFRPETLDGCPTMTDVNLEMAFRLWRDTP